MSGSIRDAVALADKIGSRDPSRNVSKPCEQTETPNVHKPQSEDERLKEALYTACADSFINELPNGTETMPGEKGSGLSEGQMQRLAVARAIYSGSPVLLLDECTSALDPQTER